MLFLYLFLFKRDYIHNIFLSKTVCLNFLSTLKQLSRLNGENEAFNNHKMEISSIIDKIT